MKLLMVSSSYLFEGCYLIVSGPTAIREQVVHCFSPDEPEECLKRLELVAADESNPNQQWAKSTLSVMQKNDQSLMKVQNNIFFSCNHMFNIFSSVSFNRLGSNSLR